jgi:hypothetical protein
MLPCYDLQEEDGRTLLVPISEYLDFDPELVTSEDRQLLAQGNLSRRKTQLEGVVLTPQNLKETLFEPVIYQWIAGVRAYPAVKHLDEVGGLQEVWFEDQRYLFHFIQSELKYDETNFLAVGFAQMSI